jgi:hypothetical protein
MEGPKNRMPIPAAAAKKRQVATTDTAPAPGRRRWHPTTRRRFNVRHHVELTVLFDTFLAPIYDADGCSLDMMTRDVTDVSLDKWASNEWMGWLRFRRHLPAGRTETEWMPDGLLAACFFILMGGRCHVFT